MWDQLAGMSEIIAIRDTPHFPYEVPACVEEKGINECHIDREQLMEAGKLTEEGRDIPDHVHLVDFTDLFCDKGQCYSTINNILVYRDTNHITSTFSQTLAEPMKRKLEQVIDSLE